MSTTAPRFVARVEQRTPPVPARQARPAAAPLRSARDSRHSAAEREADRVAAQVMALPAGAPRRSGPAGAPPSAAALQAGRALGGGGGQPLPAALKHFMEARLDARLDAVRLHDSERSARLARGQQARAFTLGADIFMGRGAFQPDSAAGRALVAHELTHTIQQGAVRQGPAPRRAALAAPRPVALPRLAASAPPVQQRTAPQVQRLGISDALDYFAEKAHYIPGFRMFTLVIGVNPVNMSTVERSPANLLRAVIELVPGGALVTQALDNHGIVDRVAAWMSQQFNALAGIGASVRASIDEFLDSLSWTDIFDLGGLWDRAKRIVTEPINQLIDFGASLIGGIIGFIKEAILRPLGRLAEGTAGYDLLKAVLGFDPVTGDAVPRTADTLIGGFMKLIGQDEVWQNLKKGNAVARAWAWFQGALGGLMGFVREIPSTFVAAFTSLELVDIVLVPRAFAKLARVFGSFFGRFMSWAGGTVLSLLEILFSVVAPGAMPYIRRAAGALASIFRNPIGFVGNLVRAAKAGFLQFAGRFGAHLKAGLIDWLTGSLPGVYIPRSFALPEILKLALSVLGLSYAHLRGKLVRAVGEPAVKAIEMGVAVVKTLVTEGPVAAWDQLKTSLGNLKQMVVDGIIDMVVGLITQKAIPKLVAMFIPGAGFISAIVAIYDTIMVFINRLSRIIQVVTGFLNSIAAIASGAIGAAANRVESVLAGLLSLAISFLAGFAGLGKVADRVMQIIQRVRAPIDAALDRLVAWIVGLAKRLMGALKAGAKRVLNWWKKKRSFGGGSESHTLLFSGQGRAARLQVRSTPMTPEAFVARFDLGPGTAQQRATITGLCANIAKVQADLVAAEAASPQDEARLTTLDGQLDQAFTQLADALAALVGAGEVDGAVADIKITRPSFTVETATAMNPTGQDLVAAKLDRRHIVSSKDMAQHYETTLKGESRWAKAKALLLARGETVAKPLSNAAIEAAARARHLRFFNDLKNLFLGGASINRSLGRRLDRGQELGADGKPIAGSGFTDAQIKAHLRDVNNRWALKGSVAITT
ncbi:DUF4157 domain-containing protein [Ideonella sp. 4Y16]|uniref:DUF4157 domain-containing protein n=1 Tax=Ideonella alba TaxID=2824118 RepID=A0A940YBM7_9BURK|nr:DUF4157 domain-containing protein [Ideonella alba]MBQ0930071.1 DUF4157 domain-containing protein [Ideonella alba]MBQ0946131.1 DUF4157 domain-containing protein [Ideonella alba]